MFWAQVNESEWGGCFASGESLDELVEALCEAIGLYVTPGDEEPSSIWLRIDGMELRVRSERDLRPAVGQGATGPLPASMPAPWRERPRKGDVTAEASRRRRRRAWVWS